MIKVAIIETKPSKNDYADLFDNQFEFDRYSLTSDPTLAKVLKKDVDININIDEYDWVILVGTEPLKHYTKLNAITSYTGRIVEDKFIPSINPAMLHFKPEAKKVWEETKGNIIAYVTGQKKYKAYSTDGFLAIDDTKNAKEYILAAYDSTSPCISLDTETTALYPRNGYILGLSLSFANDSGAYISTECLDEECCELLQKLFNHKIVVFHNAKFDIPFLKFHFGFTFPNFEDTMLMHYMLDETPGTHGLKELALRFTKYGDYEREQNDWIAAYCKEHKIKKEEFSFEFIPFEILSKYAAIDACVTYLLYQKFRDALSKNDRLYGVYKQILIPGCLLLIDVQENGIPFDKSRLIFVEQKMSDAINSAKLELLKHPEVKMMEELEGKEFNPNSPTQLRKLLFDYIGLSPTGKITGTGKASTDAEVLETLALEHPLPKLILDIRKSSKIKNTYIDKIIPQLDKDGRLRTNFNQHVTTSGRLSSSGKLNAQQLPRDNPSVKGCIKARPGYKIVSMDQYVGPAN